MKETYSVDVDGEYVFKLSQEDLRNLDILQEKKSHYHLLVQDKSYHAKVISSDLNERTYDIEINGKKFNIKIQTPLDTLIEDMGLTIKSEKNIDELRAPMPGLIININVNEGDEVKENEPLIILEAMKMENVMLSPRNGKIKLISVEKGQTVDKNELLIEFE